MNSLLGYLIVYTMGSETSKNDKDILSKLLSSLGLSYEVPESQINAYCGLFASGIGFVSYLKVEHFHVYIVCIICYTKKLFSDVPDS